MVQQQLFPVVNPCNQFIQTFHHLHIVQDL